jgi:hypothetical protein
MEKCKRPLVLAFTGAHFSAAVGVEGQTRLCALCDHVDGTPLPVRFAPPHVDGAPGTGALNGGLPDTDGKLRAWRELVEDHLLVSHLADPSGVRYPFAALVPPGQPDMLPQVRELREQYARGASTAARQQPAAGAASSVALNPSDINTV